MLIIAIGSRGDVQPAAVLAGAATRAGTPSSVLAVEEYGPLVQSHGAGFIGIEGRIDDSLGLAKNRLTRPLAHLLVTQGWMLQRWMKHLAPAIADATLRALEDHDSVLTSSLTVSLGPAIEATGSTAETSVPPSTSRRMTLQGSMAPTRGSSAMASQAMPGLQAPRMR